MLMVNARHIEHYNHSFLGSINLLCGLNNFEISCTFACAYPLQGGVLICRYVVVVESVRVALMKF